MAKIDINFKEGKDFKPRVKHKMVWMFYVGCSFFICLGFVMLYLVGEDGLAAIISMDALMLIMIITIWYQASGRTIRYHINPKGLYLKRSWIKKLFAFDEIEEVRKIGRKEVELLAREYDNQRVSGVNSENLIDAMGGQAGFSYFIMFSSVQFVGVEARGAEGVGLNQKIISSKIKTNGNFVLVTFKNGNKRIISPEDIGAFLSTYEEAKTNKRILFSSEVFLK